MYDLEDGSSQGHATTVIGRKAILYTQASWGAPLIFLLCIFPEE